MHRFFLILIVSLFLSSFAQALYPIPEYELLVIENIPQNVSLDMSLNQIEKEKEKSEFQNTKRRVYKVVSKYLRPLLSDKSFTTGYDLVALASKLPAQKILQKLLSPPAASTASTYPSDFLILVLPKTPNSLNRGRRYPYEKLYSQNKAAVIDDRDVGVESDGDYHQALNRKVAKAISFTYKRNYKEFKKEDAFFIGALLHLHLDGPASFFHAQVAGSLPSNLEFPFEQSEKEVHFKKFKSPLLSADRGYFYDDFSGALINVDYRPHNPKPIHLDVEFGQLGLIKNNKWSMKNSLPELTKNKASSDGELGIRSYLKRFNVPHLWGEIQPIQGFCQIPLIIDNLDCGTSLDSWLEISKAYNLKVNLHQIEIDVSSLRITKMRTTVELEYKDSNRFWEFMYRYPTTEIPFVTKQVIDGANATIEPYRKQMNELINEKGKILTHPETQNRLIELINQLLSNETGGL